MNFKTLRCAVALAFVLAGAVVGFTQTAGPIARYAATTVNTSSPGDTVRFDLLRWSTDAERDQVFTAISGGETALSGVLQKAPTVGYIWTTESAGYSLRYAFKTSLPDGGDRIILATDRAIGSYEPQRWKVNGAAKATDYLFTVVEIHISKAGLGEGKASLTVKVVADKEAKTIALENYTAAPVLFQSVKK